MFQCSPSAIDTQQIRLLCLDVHPYLGVSRCAWCHWSSLYLVLFDHSSGRFCNRSVKRGCVIGSEWQEWIFYGYGRGGGGGPGCRARGEGSHLNGQVLGAGQATAAEVVIRVSVHHQHPGALRHFTDATNHLQMEESSDREEVKLKVKLKWVSCHCMHVSPPELACTYHTCSLTKILSDSYYTLPSSSSGQGKSSLTGMELIVCTPGRSSASPGHSLSDNHTYMILKTLFIEPSLTWWWVSFSTLSPFTSTTRSPARRPAKSAEEPGSTLRMNCPPLLRSPCRWNP